MFPLAITSQLCSFVSCAYELPAVLHYRWLLSYMLLASRGQTLILNNIEVSAIVSSQGQCSACQIGNISTMKLWCGRHELCNTCFAVAAFSLNIFPVLFCSTCGTHGGPQDNETRGLIRTMDDCGIYCLNAIANCLGMDVIQAAAIPQMLQNIDPSRLWGVNTMMSMDDLMLLLRHHCNVISINPFIQRDEAIPVALPDGAIGMLVCSPNGPHFYCILKQHNTDNSIQWVIYDSAHGTFVIDDLCTVAQFMLCLSAVSYRGPMFLLMLGDSTVCDYCRITVCSTDEQCPPADGLGDCGRHFFCSHCIRHSYHNGCPLCILQNDA